MITGLKAGVNEILWRGSVYQRRNAGSTFRLAILGSQSGS